MYSQIGTCMWECTFCGLDHSSSRVYNPSTIAVQPVRETEAVCKHSGRSNVRNLYLMTGMNDAIM